MKEIVWSEPDHSLFPPDFDHIRATMKHYCSLVDQVLSVLTPDLLKPMYREENEKNPTFGHCYVASEAIYHLDGKKLQPYYGKDDRGITHWWLMDERNHILVDATCEQYYSKGLKPPYESGIRSSFLTNEPSKRADQVMWNVKLLGFL